MADEKKQEVLNVLLKQACENHTGLAAIAKAMTDLANNCGYVPGSTHTHDAMTKKGLDRLQEQFDRLLIVCEQTDKLIMSCHRRMRSDDAIIQPDDNTDDGEE